MAKKIDKQTLRMKIQELDIDNELKSQLLDAVSEKKTFGLVWEEKEEEAQERLREELPVFVEDESKRIVNSDDAPNHVVIEGDNLHALTALSYSHEGKFDAIYIDPPYNSGARDWKYNNDYVDKEDEYRHSKWLDMMKHRLDIAKRLLNPDNSVLIVTIDEKEYLHLGCLLEEMFSNGRMQMISTVINPKGVARNGFSRNDEYIYFIMIGESAPARLALNAEWSSSALASQEREEEKLSPNPDWTSMMRRGSNSSREHSPGCYYPIYADPLKKIIVQIGPAIEKGIHKAEEIDGLVQILPIRTNGSEGCWQVAPNELKTRMEQGRIRLGKPTSYGFVVNYLPDGAYKELFSESWTIIGRADDNSIVAKRNDTQSRKLRIAPTQWKIASHNASENGTTLLTTILGENVFSYPKSIFAVYDTLRFFVDDKPNAKILDFFAGSGTTLHATMMLNEADGGNRQCILVSNDESNICEDVTYERNKRVINGYTKPKGEFVEGLHHNNLRFYRTEFVPRDLSTKGQRDLMAASTDLLCIKNDLYDEKEMFGNIRLRKHIARYFDNGKDKMLIIYKVEAIESLVAEMMEMPDDAKIKVYVFSTNNYAMEADFEDVADKVELYAMPAALWNAYKKVLPKKLNTIKEEEDNA